MLAAAFINFVCEEECMSTSIQYFKLMSLKRYFQDNEKPWWPHVDIHSKTVHTVVQGNHKWDHMLNSRQHRNF